MKNSLRFLFSIFIVAVVLGLVMSPSGSTAQDKQKAATDKSAKAAAGAKDDHIAGGSEVNNPKSTITPPSSKGGPATKSLTSRNYITLHNYTAWYIKIYADGYYRGTIGPYDDSSVYTTTYPAQLYGRADFDDGSYLYWGPRAVYDSWRLDP